MLNRQPLDKRDFHVVIGRVFGPSPTTAKIRFTKFAAKSSGCFQVNVLISRPSPSGGVELSYFVSTERSIIYAHVVDDAVEYLRAIIRTDSGACPGRIKCLCHGSCRNTVYIKSPIVACTADKRDLHPFIGREHRRR